MNDSSTPAFAPKKRLHQNPAVQIATVLIIQVCTLLASNYKAKMEAKAKADETHLQAQAGYSVMVEAVRKMELRDAEQMDRIARLEGEVQILARHLDAHTSEWKPVIRHGRAPEPPTSAYDALAVVKKAPAAPVKVMRLPGDIAEAVQWGKRAVSP